MKDRRYGRVRVGDTLPYGTLVGASVELRNVYYYYCKDEDLPPLPEIEPDLITYYDPDEETDPRIDLLLTCLDVLKPREKHLLTMRYLHDMTLEECGTYMKLTRERVRQIEARMLRRLKQEYRIREGLDDDQRRERNNARQL